MLIRLLRSAFRRQSPLATTGPTSFRDLVTGVIHVGAHVGDERGLYDEAGVGVVWVEPIPELYAQLCENIRPYPRQRAVCHLVTDRDDAEYAGSGAVLTATDSAEMAPGDAFLIETPGGGGYGRA